METVELDTIAAPAAPAEPVLTPSQAVAFGTLMDFATDNSGASMCVMEGWAGTGKTFLVSRLLTAPALADLRIAVAAPTNKAVRVLRDKLVEAGCVVAEKPVEDGRDDWDLLRGHREPETGISFGSIHSLLGLKLKENDDGSQECRKEGESKLHFYNLVVVDECSMIGSELFAHILAAKREALVLFVGDPAQLPPIEAGVEVVSPTFSRVNLKVTLSEVVRQAKDNPIIRLSIRIRDAIEAGERIGVPAIAAALPPMPAKAGLCAGGPTSAVDIALYEIHAGRDARVIAFTNDRVIAYNHAIHAALHGNTRYPFVAGEPVIVHSQIEVDRVEEGTYATLERTTLITSEELVVVEVLPRRHPEYPDIPACRLILRSDADELAGAYVVDSQGDLDRAISTGFSRWRELKARADELARAGRGSDADRMRIASKDASSAAWALRKAFAPLRHAYAITSHKSQGSTFDSAIVDLGDLSKMRSVFQFNRALYVAATRAREHLAIVM